MINRGNLPKKSAWALVWVLEPVTLK